MPVATGEVHTTIIEILKEAGFKGIPTQMRVFSAVRSKLGRDADLRTVTLLLQRLAQDGVVKNECGWHLKGFAPNIDEIIRKRVDICGRNGLPVVTAIDLIEERLHQTSISGSIKSQARLRLALLMLNGVVVMIGRNLYSPSFVQVRT